MKPSEIIEAIERLFLDIIAYVIPGASLVLGMALLLSRSLLYRTGSYVEQNGYLIWFFIFGAYVLGQALETFGELVTERIAAQISKLFSLLPQRLKWRFTRALISHDELEESITKSDVFFAALKKLQMQDPSSLSISKQGLRVWRNIALSEGSAEQKHLVYRFMFISILNLGMATVCFVLATTLLITVILRAVAVRPITWHVGLLHWVTVASLFGLGYCFLDGEQHFIVGRCRYRSLWLSQFLKT